MKKELYIPKGTTVKDLCDMAIRNNCEITISPEELFSYQGVRIRATLYSDHFPRIQESTAIQVSQYPENEFPEYFFFALSKSITRLNNYYNQLMRQYLAQKSLPITQENDICAEKESDAN